MTAKKGTDREQNTIARCIQRNAIRARAGTSDGIAINKEHPRRHRETSTYGSQADVNLIPCDALGRGVKDAREIYQQDRLYTPAVRQSLQELIQQDKTANKGLFDK